MAHTTHIAPLDLRTNGRIPAIVAQAGLTPAQADGIACIRCGNEDGPMQPVGTRDGVQLFACTPACPVAEQLAVDSETAREHPDYIVYQQGAIYTANKIEAAALSAPNPATTLAQVADALPEVLPTVLDGMGAVPGTAEAILPDVTARVLAFQVLHQAKSTADGAYGEALDIMLDAVRSGADPADVGEEVLGLLAETRA
ncbi:hypothetical protein [Streptomyces sp. MH13]|uniref:hypothetical protein n=1 Tax=Streptomyces sp. MH13 TaxID=3417651 RepID=UPI003CF3287F